MFSRMLVLVILTVLLLWFFARPALAWLGAKIVKNVGLDEREDEKKDGL